ncbi:MAG TPA: twin-arginine translocase subunit TatC [Ktedonobacteraceae bacterium]|jgi:sec-independent protein translocase protein TatC
MATSETDQQNSLIAEDEDSAYDEENDPSAMSLVDHLEELRWRIFKSLIAIVVCSIVAFIFRDWLMNLLEGPLPAQANALHQLGLGGKLVVTGIAEGFTIYLKVSVAAGIIAAIPVILYQTWAFIAPGLYENEKRHAVPFILAGIVLFVIGVTVGYIVLRYPIQWLVNFASASFTELITADSYFGFVAFFVLAFGLVFELPLVLTFMAKVGIISGETLKRKRTAAHIGMWVAATFLTPGADIYSPIILGTAMSFLYELSIIFIRFAVRDNA